MSNLHDRTFPIARVTVYATVAAALRPAAPDERGICGKKVVIAIKRRDRIISAFDWTAFFGTIRPMACRKRTWNFFP
ncbi:hypothetical protein [Mesorhizobium sp. B2-4-6]|uniref:hypothetical protein n=1 Tax=Mesorhizobium sp. B2-4-6 TaxID=2589943 RepID=UPI0011268B69|nr:hypothetical protein [Mesorhizobium sp. B2-4-6]TPL54626.1 hypothetical protein FJ957_04515 [Mesorhizobium sp. B2-4-6]